MRVLHVITGLGVGGAELQLRSILRCTRHDAEVVALYNPGAVADMILDDGFRVHDLGMTRNTQLSAVLRLRDLIRRGDYDVVHVHLYRACVYGRIAAKMAGGRTVVTTEHSIGETHLERRRMTLGVRGLYLGTELCSDATIAVSDTVAERLVNWGVPSRKITVIPNGVDFDRVAFDPDARARIREEFGIPTRSSLIGVLGRLDPNKRFDLVIEAAAPLLRSGARLLIVGDGPDRDRLERLTREHGVVDQVVFAGQRHDVAAILSALDLFLAPSRQETFGLSVLEALANGVVALYTTCPALADVETDRARQVPGTAEDLRREIATELTSVRPRTEEPAVRERYGIEAVTGRIDDLYERLRERREQSTTGTSPAPSDRTTERTGGRE
ncbi:glycosyltransferase involved in cell wall biosynthesis [Saccharopolyspora lacisalsi]|uniref:Glycosyltransferase involved in cell wall biosynthesis n=1 Tax=Halosaccharopolyspora lacisalsi TaxID=1000566 RepID=A0A839DTL4_9PSEU|nr:glycosyltransferase [Halosaccharopolyspora lacisalsi]MBA8824383.1 glycosyltransferase involved in cell wall biosynthesis [Halosaccharopolyspora lacisalsi]